MPTSDEVRSCDFMSISTVDTEFVGLVSQLYCMPSFSDWTDSIVNVEVSRITLGKCTVCTGIHIFGIILSSLLVSTLYIELESCAVHSVLRASQTK